MSVMDLCFLEGWRSSSVKTHTNHRSNHAALMFTRKYLPLTEPPDLQLGPQFCYVNMTKKKIPEQSQPLPKSILHTGHVHCLWLHHHDLSSSLGHNTDTPGREEVVGIHHPLEVSMKPWPKSRECG